MKTASAYRPLRVAAALLASLGSIAAAAPPGQADERLPLWELSLGAGAVSTPAYPGSDEHVSRALALPYLIYRGEILRSDRSLIGARLGRTERTEFDIGFAAALPARSADVAARTGMPDLGPLIEFGPRASFTLARPDPASRLRLELPLRMVIEARGGLRRQGWSFEPRLVLGTRAEQALWNGEASLALVLGDARLNRYFYQVGPEFAMPGRPAYASRSGLMLVRAGLFGSRRLTPDLRLFGFVRLESYAGAANRDSPLMKRTSGASAGFAFVWTFARSSEPAR